MHKFPGFDHIDMRVPSLIAVEPFYDALLPLLGLTFKKQAHVDAAGDWHEPGPGRAANASEYYETAEPGNAACFIGIIEDATMTVTRTRVAFRVAPAELPGWEQRLRDLGARNVERSADLEAYPAIFFEDPLGTRLEVSARKPRA
jgi:hypothetical protein